MRRKLRSDAEKIKIAEEAIDYKRNIGTLTQYAAENDMNYNMLNKWVNEYRRGVFGNIQPEPETTPEKFTLPKSLASELSENFNNPVIGLGMESVKHDISVYMYEGEKKLFTIPVMIPVDLTDEEAKKLVRHEIMGVLCYIAD